MLYSQLCFQYCSEKQLLYISRKFQENTIVFEGEHEQKVEKIMVIPHGVGSKHHTSIITFLLFSKIFYPNITRQVFRCKRVLYNNQLQYIYQHRNLIFESKLFQESNYTYYLVQCRFLKFISI